MEVVAVVSSILGVLMLAGGLYDRLFGGLSTRLRAIEGDQVKQAMDIRDLKAGAELREAQQALALEHRLQPLQSSVDALRTSVDALRGSVEAIVRRGER